MMIRRILAVMLRDLKSGTRDFMILFILVMPFALAFLLKAIIPGVGSTSMRLAVLSGAAPSLASFLEDFAAVEVVGDRVVMEDRIMRTDDVFGVVETSTGFEIVRQGNETEGTLDTLRLILNSKANSQISLPIIVDVDDVGWKMPPIKLEGAIFLLIFCTVFGGMLIALGIVEEKMSNTLSAINAAPLSRAEFVIGKAILGFIVPFIGAAGIIFIMGFPGINLGMTALTIGSIALISVIIGFSIGVVASEPIGAIASMKTIFLPVFASVFGGIFLSEKWQILLYWSPHYWAYRTMKSIILKEAEWPEVGLSALIILAITVVVFLLLSKKISRGLQ